MSDDVKEVVKRMGKQKFEPSDNLRMYVQHFSGMGVKFQSAEIRYLQSIMKKQIFRIESVKLREKMKRI